MSINVKNITKTLVLGLSVALISACSGSGSSDNTQTGHYKDAGPVAGLHYATATQSGTTGARGEFRYQPGETVTFSLGNIVIGKATAAANLNTFNLAGITPPTTGFGIPNNIPASLSFQQAANISVLLQTLDEDRNLDNGIQIPAQAASIATSNLNFYQPYGKFNDSWDFRQFIGNCRAAGIWGGSRPIKKTGYALNDLYKGLGITATLSMPTEIITTLNGNATRNVYTYDDYGNLTKTEEFNTNNALVQTTVNSYNENGDLVNAAYYDANNQLSNLYTAGYDANGYTTSISTFGSSNNLVYQANITVDNYGNQTVYENYLPNVPQSYYRQTLTYNNLGQLTELKTFNGSGTLVWYETSSYSDSSTLPSRQDTYDGNGVLTGYALWTYNAFGEALTYQSFDANNTPQYQMVNAYDSNGNTIQRSGQGMGNQYTETLTYNSEGYLTLKQYTDSQNVSSSETYAYDAEGNLISITAGSLVETRRYKPTNLWQILLNPIIVRFG